MNAALRCCGLVAACAVTCNQLHPFRVGTPIRPPPAAFCPFAGIFTLGQRMSYPFRYSKTKKSDPMDTTEQRNSFLLLRGNGWSLRKISAKLNIPKSTLASLVLLPRSNPPGFPSPQSRQIPLVKMGHSRTISIGVPNSPSLVQALPIRKITRCPIFPPRSTPPKSGQLKNARNQGAS